MVTVGTAAFFIDRLEFLQDIVKYKDLPDNMRDRNYQVACAIICWALSFLEFIAVCCFTKQIRVCTYVCLYLSDWYIKSSCWLHSWTMSCILNSSLYHNYADMLLSNLANIDSPHIFIIWVSNLANWWYPLWFCWVQYKHTNVFNIVSSWPLLVCYL